MNSPNMNNRPATAALFVLGAMALFGLIDNFVRLAAETGGLWQFHFLRSVIALFILMGFAYWRGIRIAPRNWKPVALRSVLATVAMVIYFGCLGLMPIAQVVAGLFTAPVFVVIFSVIFFKERVGPRRVLAVVIGFAGALLALQPDAGEVGLINAIPVVAGAGYALSNIATRRWCGDESTPTLLGGFFGLMMVWGLIGVVVLSVWPVAVPEGADGFILRGWVRPEGVFLAMIIIQGIGSLIGVGLTIRAYQLAEAAFVAVLENLLLVFATVWAALLWGEWPDLWSGIGLVMILIAGVVIAIRSPEPPSIRLPAGESNSGASRGAT